MTSSNCDNHPPLCLQSIVGITAQGFDPTSYPIPIPTLATYPLEAIGANMWHSGILDVKMIYNKRACPDLIVGIGLKVRAHIGASQLLKASAFGQCEASSGRRLCVPDTLSKFVYNKLHSYQ